MFPPLCPFSSVLFRISFWFPDDFGLFYAFSVLYVHFLLLSSVFLSGFRMILDFFTAFSRLYVHFHLLGSVFPSSFRTILDFFTAFSVLYVHFLLPGSVFPSSFRMILDFFLLFLCFMSILIGSVPYFLLASGYFWTLFLFFSVLCPYERIRKSPTCVEFRNLQTTKSSESSGLRNVALRRIKRSAITPFLFQKLLSQLPS